MAYRDGDIAGLLEDTGVEFIHDGTVTKALLDTPDAVFLEAAGISGLIGKSVIALIQTSKHPDIKVGNTVTLDGTEHRVIERLRADDGGTTQLLCSLDF